MSRTVLLRSGLKVRSQLKPSNIFISRVYLHRSRYLRSKNIVNSKSASKNPSQNNYEAFKEDDKPLTNNPAYQEMLKEFNEHQHVHMRESEFEKNDCVILGTMEGKDSTNLRINLKQKVDISKETHFHAESHSHVHDHSHSHTHNHSHNPLLILSSEEFRKNPGVKITWIGLATNVGIAIGKFTGGIVFHSQALLADAVHALCDMVSDLLTLFSVGLAANKPNPNYPYGYGKIETVGSLAVSSILFTAGLSIGWSSLCTMVGPIVPTIILENLTMLVGQVSHHSHGVPEDVTNINAAWVAAASIAVKEWIFRATKKIALETNSNVLMANAWHHRIDSLTSLVALVTITSGFFLNIQSLDAFGGLVVSGLIIKAGAEGMIDAVKELADQSIPKDDERYEDVKDVIDDTLRALISNNNSKTPYSLKDLTLLASGPNLCVHARLVVPLQRWRNILGIQEFEIVSDHLRRTVYKEIPNVQKLNIEYISEQSNLTQKQ